MTTNTETLVPEKNDAAKKRAKWITLVVLVAWVIAVFIATMLKFAKVW